MTGVRDDRITVRGPFEVPPLEVAEYWDEERGLVPAHTLDMSHMREFVFDSACVGCGRRHVHGIFINWDRVLGWPELAEYAIESGARALLWSLEECARLTA